MKIQLSNVLVEAVVMHGENQIAEMQKPYETFFIENTGDSWYMLKSGAMKLVSRDAGELVFQRTISIDPDADIKVYIHVYGTTGLMLAIDLAETMISES